MARRKAFAAIREGRVTVGGTAALEPSAPFDGHGELRLDGAPLIASAEAKVYLVMNKPPATIAATSDPHGRGTVMDLVPVEMRVPGLHPVGRLDLDTTGLLLLTNDGDFTQKLTHPRNEVEKEYWLSARPPLIEDAREWLREGVDIDGELRLPVAVKRLPEGTGFETSIVIREGRKRQVRRMVEAAGSRVLRLKRVREGPLLLGALEEGTVRALTPAEVAMLSGQSRRKAALSAASSRSRTSARRR